MALTLGTGPLGPRPAGRFDVDPPSTPLLFWEPFPKRFRVVVGEETVADSRRAIALHETGEMMRLGVPVADVERDLLVAGAISKGRSGGPIRSWAVETRKCVVGEAATSFEQPPERAACLRDHVFFDLDKADRWYLEDDPGYAHPRDPYHRFDVHRSSRHVVVTVGDVRIAEHGLPAVLFETGLPPRFYVPPDAVRSDLLVKSATVTQCPYKGDAQHWHVVADGRRIDDAVWSLTTPMGDALAIPGWFSFYADKIDVDVDGDRVSG